MQWLGELYFCRRVLCKCWVLSTNTDFKEAYEASQNPLVRDNSPWLEYNLQEKLLFRGGQLCIPDFSMRENITREKHSCFSVDKKLEQLSHFYFWKMM